MPDAVSVLVEFVLDHVDDLPVGRRAAIYSALGAIAPSPAEARQFNRLAADLRGIEARHDQLLLNFRQRSDRSGNGAKS